MSGAVVQLVRMPACHAGGRGFDPRPFRQYLKVISYYFYYADMAQLVERTLGKGEVLSSILSISTISYGLDRSRLFSYINPYFYN